MFNKGEERVLPATGEPVRVGDYSLGSPQSRAAARARLEQLQECQDKLDVVVVQVGKPMFTREHGIGKWNDGIRVSRLPSGLSIEEAERIVAEHGATRLSEVWNSRQMSH